MTKTEIIQASKTRKLSAMNAEFIKKIVKIRLEKACKMLMKDLPDIDLISGEYTRYLKYHQGNMTEGELEILFFEGSTMNYGEVYNLSIGTLIKWTNQFNNEAKRIKAKIYHRDNETLNMNEKMNFLVANMDKLPSLRELMNKY